MRDDDLTISQVAELANVPLARLKTMRHRGHAALFDDGDDSEAEGRVWRRYTIADAVSVACVLELVGKGMGGEEAASAVRNCRDHIHDGPHPNEPSIEDVFVGVMHFNEGRAHVGGPFRALLNDIDIRFRKDLALTKRGGATGLFLANASECHRAVMERLNRG